MAKKRSGPVDSVGWVFWLVCFGIFAVPSIYLMLQYTYEDTTLWGPIMFGIVLAATCAGITSWLVNSALQFRQGRIEKAKRAKKAKNRT